MDETLIALIKRIGLTALDVGARGGVNADLSAIASAVDYFAFEPDRVECQRLNSTPAGDWKTTRFIPVALAAEAGEFSLNLYSKRGCTSKYEARQDLGKLFSRESYYDLDKVINVPCQPLDELVQIESIQEPAYMKIDVQSMEIEVFNGAVSTLRNNLCAVRTEVSFFPMYKDQPLFAEIDQRLRRDGFVPMRWLENHEWRRRTTKKPRSLDSGEVPYSRGQLIHADILYLQDPEGMSADSLSDLKRLVRLGILATCFEHYDHALAAFSIPAVRQFCLEEMKLDPEPAVKRMSQKHATLLRKLSWRLLRLLEKNFS
jgi:FkbM family methyltransferase